MVATQVNWIVYARLSNYAFKIAYYTFEHYSKIKSIMFTKLCLAIKIVFCGNINLISTLCDEFGACVYSYYLWLGPGVLVLLLSSDLSTLRPVFQYSLRSLY